MFDPQQTEQKVSHCLLLICHPTCSKQIKKYYKDNTSDLPSKMAMPDSLGILKKPLSDQ